MPFLDHSQTPSGHAWPVGVVPQISGIQASSAIPTPPTEGEGYAASGELYQAPSSMGTIVQPPAHNSNFDHMSASTSFTARRSAASNLPNFELPPPPLSKFPGLASYISQPVPTNHANNNVGNLLTPPSNIPGEVLSPISSGNNSVQNNTAASQGHPPQTPNSLWTSGTGLTPFASFGTGTTPQSQSWGQGSSENLLPPRGLFSPSLNTLLRNNSGSPNTSEGVPPPPYGYQLPPFSTSMSFPNGSLPALTPQQQQQAMVYMSSQPQTSMSVQSPPALNTSDSYIQQRAPPTPSYYNGSQPSSTPQQSQFPALSNPSPVQQSLSPLSAGPPSSRLSPPHNQSNMMQPASSQPMQSYQRPFGSGFPLPNMSGPIMSNAHSPGGQMSVVGMPPGLISGFNSGHVAGHVAHLQQIYSQQTSVPHNDRPFKCDQCPQSFNRNHDLKRHKRIHLAVKPFPCGYCDKSFSRKDALKVICAFVKNIALRALIGFCRGTFSSKVAAKPKLRPTGVPQAWMTILRWRKKSR